MVQRQGDKGSARLDDQRKGEVDSLVHGAPAELARHLRLSAFPADRDALMAVANDEHAPDAVLSMLRQLPPGQRFETVQDVWATPGGPTEGTRT